MSSEQHFAFSVRHDKVPTRGEDGPPVVRVTAKGTWLAVFDGMGGSGGFVAETDTNPLGRTHAALASSCAERVVVEFIQGADDGLRTLQALSQLAIRLVAGLDDLDRTLGRARSRLRSSLLQVLPTTVAIAALPGAAWRSETRPTLDVLWAGDSRVYALSPFDGLQQLSTDDIVADADALSALLNEPRMSNFVSLRERVSLHHRLVPLTLPVVLIAATDGCFDYFPSPMHFEHFLLDSLQKSVNASYWRKRLLAGFKRVAGDDATLALATHGFASWDEVVARFAPRHEHLRDAYIAPLEGLMGRRDQTAIADPFVEGMPAAREREWERYKVAYEAHMHAPINTIVVRWDPDVRPGDSVVQTTVFVDATSARVPAIQGTR